MSNNITADQVKAFVKNNMVICILILVNFVLFILLNSYGNDRDKYANQADQEQLKVKNLETELAQLKTIDMDLAELEKVDQELWGKCLNFGKRTSLYKFLNKISEFLNESKETFVANLTNAYNLTKSQTISLEQDVSEFHGDYVLGEYTINFKVTFAQLIHFIQQMQEMEYFLQMKQIEIRAENSTDLGELTVILVYHILGKIKIKEEEAPAHA